MHLEHHLAAIAASLQSTSPTWRFPAKDVPQYSNIHYKHEREGPDTAQLEEDTNACIRRIDELLIGYREEETIAGELRLGTDDLERMEEQAPTLKQLWTSAELPKPSFRPKDFEDEAQYPLSAYSLHPEWEAHLGDELPNPTGRPFTNTAKISRSARAPQAKFLLQFKQQDLDSGLLSDTRPSVSEAAAAHSGGSASPSGKHAASSASPLRLQSPHSQSASPRTGTDTWGAVGSPSATARSGVTSPRAGGTNVHTNGAGSSPRLGSATSGSGRGTTSAGTHRSGGGGGAGRDSDSFSEDKAILLRLFARKGVRPPAVLMDDVTRRDFLRGMDMASTQKGLDKSKQEIVDNVAMAAMAEKFRATASAVGTGSSSPRPVPSVSPSSEIPHRAKGRPFDITRVLDLSGIQVSAVAGGAL